MEIVDGSADVRKIDATCRDKFKYVLKVQAFSLNSTYIPAHQNMMYAIY